MVQEDPEYTMPQRRKFFQPFSHYHGSVVRQLFIGAATFILIVLPFHPDLLPISPMPVIILVVLLALFAALTNPYQRWVCGADTAIAGLGVLVFEYYAVIGYQSDDLVLFLARQVLAIAFLFALYYASRTFRAMVLEQVKQRKIDFRDER